jgi:hypothetical protein
VEPFLTFPAQERKRARDRLSVPGQRPQHGYRGLSGEGELGQGQSGRGAAPAHRPRTATKYLDSASKEERDDWIAKYTGVKLEVVKEINLPLYVTEFNVSTLQANLDILVRQKLTKPFDVNAMVWKP